MIDGNCGVLGNSDNDNRQRRGSRSYDTGFTFYFNPTDLLWYVFLTDAVLTVTGSIIILFIES